MNVILVCVLFSQVIVFSAETKNTIICEDNEKTITCVPPLKISVISGIYGRNDNVTCPHQSIRTSSCKANHTDYVRSLCQYNSSCNVTASNNVTGDPCQGTYKYLTVWYQCIDQVSNKEMTESTGILVGVVTVVVSIVIVILVIVLGARRLHVYQKKSEDTISKLSLSGNPNLLLGSSTSTVGYTSLGLREDMHNYEVPSNELALIGNKNLALESATAASDYTSLGPREDSHHYQTTETSPTGSNNSVLDSSTSAACYRSLGPRENSHKCEGIGLSENPESEPSYDLIE